MYVHVRKLEVRKMVCAQVGRAQKNCAQKIVRKKIVRNWVQIVQLTTYTQEVTYYALKLYARNVGLR